MNTVTNDKMPEILLDQDHSMSALSNVQ